MTQLRLLTIFPKKYLRTNARFVRFKHDDRKRNRKNIADKSKEQLAHELADSKRKLRELKKTQRVPELTKSLEVADDVKRWQFWKRGKRPKLKEAFLAGKQAGEQALKEQDPPATEEPKIPGSFRFAKERVQKTARFAKEPEFSNKPEWKATRTAKDNSQKTKAKLSHWSHKMTTDPALSKALEEYEELRAEVEEAERKYEAKKAEGKPVKIHENARMGFRVIVHGQNKDMNLLKLPKFFNRAVPVPHIPYTAAKQREMEEKQEQQDEEREEQNKDRPKKYKKYFAIPLILWLYDWYRKKDKVRNIAKKIQAPFEIEMVQLRRILRLSNDELLQFHGWLCNHGYSDMTVDEFGLEFAKAVAHFHIAVPPSERPVVADPLEEGPPAEGEYRVRRFELFPWDIGFMWRNLDSSYDTKLPLWKHFTGICHYVHNDLAQKASVGFLVLQYEKGNPEGVLFKDMIELMRTMVDTGHFESEALVERTQWMPHQFIIRTPERMAEIIFSAANLDSKKDRMSIDQFEDALLNLGWAKWYESFFGRLEMRTWYTSKGKQKLINSRDKRLEKERKQKEEEERIARTGDDTYWGKVKAYWPFNKKNESNVEYAFC